MKRIQVSSNWARGFPGMQERAKIFKSGDRCARQKKGLHYNEIVNAIDMGRCEVMDIYKAEEELGYKMIAAEHNQRPN